MCDLSCVCLTILRINVNIKYTRKEKINLEILCKYIDTFAIFHCNFNCIPKLRVLEGITCISACIVSPLTILCAIN
jgi:hypothetical protein